VEDKDVLEEPAGSASNGSHPEAPSKGDL
jgi:hypothetical protein